MEVFLKLTFCKHLMPHEDITFDPSHGDVFPCIAPNCEHTKQHENENSSPSLSLL